MGDQTREHRNPYPQSGLSLTVTVGNDSIHTRPYHTNDLPALEKFCQQCAALNWNNNASIQAMKLDRGGKWWVHIRNKDIVGVSGVEPLFIPLLGQTQRLLFRSAMLPGNHQFSLRQGLGINIASTYDGAHTMALQHRWLDRQNWDSLRIMTTNIVAPGERDNPGAGRWTHIMMTRLSRGSVVRDLGRHVIWNTTQQVWAIDHEQYFEHRKQLLAEHSRMDLLI